MIIIIGQVGKKGATMEEGKDYTIESVVVREIRGSSPSWEEGEGVSWNGFVANNDVDEYEEWEIGVFSNKDGGRSFTLLFDEEPTPEEVKEQLKEKLGGLYE